MFATMNVYKRVTWHLTVNALKCHLTTSLQEAVLGVHFLVEEEALFFISAFPADAMWVEM